jgi:hypothetical protein
MTTTHTGSLERDWVQLGVLFGSKPSGCTPDLERLILDTARACEENSRLLSLVVTWLVLYGQFVARHRLKRLVLDELEPEFQAVLGLIIEEAVANRATRDLLIVSGVCEPLADPQPLAAIQRDDNGLQQLAERRASELSRRWGVWASPVVLKEDAVRPVTWLLQHNPEYRERIVRKGDLRASILETLLRDTTDGSIPSESALTRLSGATRTAVRKALAALQLEGMVSVGTDRSNDRDHPVRLITAA